MVERSKQGSNDCDFDRVIAQVDRESGIWLLVWAITMEIRTQVLIPGC